VIPPLPERHGLEEKRAACLIGGAVGDSFGYPVEFLDRGAIRARFGRKGIREPQPTREGRLRVSDDTQMTLFTLEGLLRGFASGGITGEIRRAYLDWLDTQGEAAEGFAPAGTLAREPVLRVRRAPGATCLTALADHGGRGTPEQPINQSKGCGGVMRVAPIGLFPARISTPEAFRLGVEAAALTHGHPSGYLSAGALCALVRELVGGAGLAQAAARAITELSGWSGREETVSRMEGALDLAAKAGGDIATLGLGWTGEEALAIGLYAVLAGAGFADTLAIAANHDGDSDSTASIAGQIYGAWKGVGEIPPEWIHALDVAEPMLGLIGQANATG
jgi:ADP-ribosylglycohydrolase